MAKDAKFSIVIPVYNTQEDYLLQCFNSVDNQTYRKYEVIVIDDGSNEKTKSILNKYSSKYKIITHEINKGIVAGRMTGIHNSTGDYVYFLDSDDIITNDCLETFNNIYKECNPDLIMIETPSFINDIKKDLIPKHLYFENGLVDKEKVMKEALSLHINGISDKIAKRELLDFTDKDVDSSILNGEDLQQSIYVILKAKSIYYVHKDVCYYRVFQKKQREYYDVRKLHDINYMVPPYKMVFEKNRDYNQYLPFYKTACVNNIIATGFLLLETNESYQNKNKYLNELNNLEITKLLASINVKIPFASQMVFSMIINKHYFLFRIVHFVFSLKK